MELVPPYCGFPWLTGTSVASCGRLSPNQIRPAPIKNMIDPPIKRRPNVAESRFEIVSSKVTSELKNPASIKRDMAARRNPKITNREEKKRP